MGTAGSAGAEATARLLRRWVAEGERWVDVAGGSMEPTIREPARVLVVTPSVSRWLKYLGGSQTSVKAGRGSRRPRRGEIWAFIGGDATIVVHRFVRREPGGYLFKGDGLASVDRPIPPGLLVGRVVAADDERGRRRFGGIDRITGYGRLSIWRARRRINRLRRR
jgi:hypothetical protein